MVNHLGQQFGNYLLTRLLGQGGYAQVYLGEHVYLHTLAALKVQHVHLGEDDAQRFLAEARMLAGLAHPHIVPVHDFGVHEGIPYLVMQYAPHGSLRTVHPRGTRLSLASIASYLTPLATAIHYAHEHGITHRDIKPENMLLGSHGLLLSDFGLAVMSSNSSLQSVQHIVGTATYMAPEQLRGYLCQATDQYALGIVVYEWLCGFPPFVGDHHAVAAQHIIAPPPSLRAAIPDLSPSIEQVILTALAKDPHERYSSVMMFANTLLEALRPLETASPTPERRSRSNRPSHSSHNSDSSSSGGNGRGGRVHRRSLIGRESELIALRQALLEAEQSLSMQSNALSPSSQIAPSWSDPSRSSCVLLRGEPGIGKTRLAEELASESYVRGWTVLWSRAYNQERSVPYLFWTQILREALRQGLWDVHNHNHHPLCYQSLIPLLPEISDLFSSETIAQKDTPEQEQWHLWEAVYMLLADICEQRPLLLVLDDLHCADNSTVELLGYLARRLRHAPLLIVGTYRDNELASTHPLALLLAHLQREHTVVELSLPALTADQIAELVADVPKPFIRQIQQQVAGNPFFAEELALAMQQQETPKDPSLAITGLPDTIAAVLGQRIRALSGRCQQFLCHAAILGNSFPFTTLTLMEQCGKMPFDEEGLFTSIEEALQARIIAEDEIGSSITYSFWHSLLQTHLYESLSAVRRALLHKQAATALQRLYASHEEEGAASITYHLVRGGAASSLVTHFAQLAGERAYRLSSYAEAEYYFVIACEHLEASPECEANRATLMQYLGECTRIQGKNDDARHYYQQVLRLQEALAFPQISPQQAQLQAMTWYEIGLTWFETGDNTKALDCYAQGERVLQQAMVADGPAWARLRYEQSYVCWRQGDYTEARTIAIAALRLFTEALEQQPPHRDLPFSATRIRRTLSGDPVDLGRTYQLLGLIANCAGLSRDALSYFQTALTYFEPYDCLREIAIVCSNLGDLYLRRADFASARAALHRSLLLVERIGDVPFSSVILNNFGLLAAKTGDLAAAETYYERGVVLSEQSNDAVSACWLLVCLATAQQEQNNSVEARDTLRRALIIARSLRALPCIGAALVAVARLRLAQVAAWRVVEEHSEAPIHTIRMALIKARKSIVHALALEGIEAETRIEGQLLLAQTMLLQGELDNALFLVTHTIQDAQKYELMALIAHAQRVRGDILLKQCQYEQAIQAFECAIADFRNFGMRLECARTLQDYGIALLKITDPAINTALHAHEYLQEARELFMLCHVTPAYHLSEHLTPPAFAS